MPSVRKTIVYLILLAALVMGITIAGITGIRYQKTVLKARESVLIDNLTRLREAVKEYTLNQDTPPKSLDDLVKAGYLREIPDDPITGHKDWQVTEAELVRETTKVKGIVDVHSASLRDSSKGIPYNQW